MLSKINSSELRSYLEGPGGNVAIFGARVQLERVLVDLLKQDAIDDVLMELEHNQLLKRTERAELDTIVKATCY